VCWRWDLMPCIPLWGSLLYHISSWSPSKTRRHQIPYETIETLSPPSRTLEITQLVGIFSIICSGFLQRVRK
jgi:hypothetical protein